MESERTGKGVFPSFSNCLLLVHRFSRAVGNVEHFPYLPTDLITKMHTLDCGVDGNDNVGDSGLMSP